MENGIKYMPFITMNYRGYEIECHVYIAYASLNGQPCFGTFSSDLDKLSAYEKMTIKIDRFLKQTKIK
jgi:hypothetical protein